MQSTSVIWPLKPIKIYINWLYAANFILHFSFFVNDALHRDGYGCSLHKEQGLLAPCLFIQYEISSLSLNNENFKRLLVKGGMLGDGRNAKFAEGGPKKVKPIG